VWANPDLEIGYLYWAGSHCYICTARMTPEIFSSLFLHLLTINRLLFHIKFLYFTHDCPWSYVLLLYNSRHARCHVGMHFTTTPKKREVEKTTVGMYFLSGQLMRECACDQRMPQFKQLTEVNCQNIQAVQYRNTDQTCRFQHLNITI